MKPLLVICFLLAGGLRHLTAAEIKGDERVLFFPTAARLSDDGSEWVVPIHGWIFEPEQNDLLRRKALAELREQLGFDADQPTSKIFEDRVRRFLVDNERGKQIEIVIGDKTFSLPESEDDGHFLGTVRVSIETARRLAPGGRLRFRAVTAKTDEREFAGCAFLVSAEGRSVISDIDDTVKVTEVTDRSRLVANTFLREFSAVEGMADLYQRWAGEGAVFYFVSASPWQLYEPLSDFLTEAGFPSAIWRLKRLRLKDSTFFKLLADPYESKVTVIEEILKPSPHRRFVLVGDSGEKDPEVYGEVARRHPQQVERIYIRDVTGDAAKSERYKAAFRDVPRERWQIFTDSARLK